MTTWIPHTVHYYEKHQERKLKCEKCSKRFLFKSKLIHHLKSCDGVLRIYKKKYHITKFDKGKMFNCNACKESYQYRSSFYKHFYKSHKEKTLKCDKCDKQFISSYKHTLHIQKCNRKVNHMMTQQNVTYKKIYLEEEGNIYQCMICEKTFQKL